MLAYAADENFNNDILRGLQRRDPTIDIVRVQDVGLSAAIDPDILAWAADQERVLLTHDVSTMTRYALERVARGAPMPGVVEVTRTLPLGRVIEDLIILARLSRKHEWAGQVLFLPL